MANYFTYDMTGALTAFAYNTSAISAPAGSTTGGSTVAVFLFGTYWNTAYNAGDVGNLNVTVFNNSDQRLGAHTSVFKAQTATTITAVEMSEQGPCNGTHVVNLRVNGATPGTNITMGTGTGTSNWTQATNIALAAGDVLTGSCSVNASGNTQVSVYLTATVAST